MKIGLCQMDLIWEDPESNLKQLDELLSKTEESIDLLVLPEMFTSGFTMAPEKIAPYHKTTLEYLEQKATGHNISIIGSWVVGDENGFYNRLHLIRPINTSINEYYNKHRLFKMAKEHLYYTPGSILPIWNINGWRLLPQICYDLRFPELPRSVLPFDIIVYVASWPERRIQAWDTLLKARSIENQAYCIGVNRIGIDGYELPYTGHSSCFDPMGEEVLFCGENSGIFVCQLDKDHLNSVKTFLPFLEDRVTITLS
jgi:omega-amidase